MRGRCEGGCCSAPWVAPGGITEALEVKTTPGAGDIKCLALPIVSYLLWVLEGAKFISPTQVHFPFIEKKLEQQGAGLNRAVGNRVSASVEFVPAAARSQEAVELSWSLQQVSEMSLPPQKQDRLRGTGMLWEKGLAVLRKWVR